MPDVAPLWREPVAHVADAMRVLDPRNVPTDDQLLAQIEQESGGSTVVISAAHAVGLGQIVSQNHPDPSFSTRPGPYWLKQPVINLAFQVTMMTDGMRLARDSRDILVRRDGRRYGPFGPNQGDLWNHALLYYYSGKLNGWGRSFAGHSGADYVDAVRDKLPRYVAQTFEGVRRRSEQEGKLARLRRLLGL